MKLRNLGVLPFVFLAIITFGCGGNSNQVTEQEKMELRQLDSLVQDLEDTRMEIDQSKNELEDALKDLDI